MSFYYVINKIIKWSFYMNFYSAIKEYNDADINSKIESASKHDFIKIVLEEVYSNMKTLSYSIQNEPKTSKNKSSSFARIITGLTILMNSLDFKNGEPIASNLLNLYDYCKREIMESYKSLNINGINVCIEIIEDLLTAWKKIR